MKSKLTILLAVVVLTITTLLLIGLHNSIKKEVVERFQLRQLVTANNLSRHVESYLNKQTNMVGVLASLPALRTKKQDILSGVVNEYFSNLKRDHIKSINIYDEKGTVIFSTLKDAVSLNHTDSKFFSWSVKKENKGKQYITSEVPAAFIRKEYKSAFQLMTVSPIYNQSSNRFVGAVAVVEVLDDILKSFYSRDTTQISEEYPWILDKDGTVLYEPEHPEMIRFNLRQNDASCFECHESFNYVETILAKHSGSIEYQLKENPKKLSSFTTLNFKNISWKIVIDAPLDEVTNFVDKNILQTLITIVIISIMLFSSSILILRSNKQRAKAKTEAEKLKGQQAFNLILECAGEGIFGLDLNGNHTFVNPKAAELLGYTVGELIGKHSHTLWHYSRPNGEPYDGKDCDIYDTIRKGTTHSGEEYFWRKDGTGFPVDYSTTPMLEGEKVIGAVVTFRDISEAKRSELEHEVIYEINRGVTTTANLDELLKLIHQALKQVLYAENIFIALHDPNTGLFSFPYFVDKFDPTPEPVAMGKSCTALVFNTGRPLLLTQDLFDQLVTQNEVELVNTNSPSWVGVPLKTPSRTIGVLVLQHYEEENIYNERDVKFLESIGSQIAVVIERKGAEEELRNERLLIRTVIDNIPDSIYCKDTACRKTLANLTELRYSGAKSEAEILGKTDFDFYPKELAEGFFADDQFVMQTDQPVLNREEYVINEKGQKQWLLTSKLPLKDEKGNMLGIVGIGRNITIRKQAEEALKESERFLKETQIIAKLGTYSWDIASGKWESSEILNSIFGIASDYDKSIEGWGSLIHLEWQKIMTDYFTQEVIGKKSKFDKEYKIVRQNDKSEHWVHGIGELKFDENNQPITMIGTIRDITERKQAEEDIKLKSEQLQKTNSEKDKFFSIIAHDLRSPFSGFINLTQIMAEESESFSKSELMDFSKSMYDSASTVYKLLENLLEWAQMQKGTISFNPQELLLPDLVSFSVNTINQRALQKGITIINEVPEAQKIYADEKMVNTVLRNFLSNAVKFTKRDGTVTVHCKKIDGEMIEVSVKDTGVGMLEKDVKRLFKMEEKVSSNGTEGELSTGLGLLLCKEFVEKNGGKVWAESVKGGGSTFYFTVPGSVDYSNNNEL